MKVFVVQVTCLRCGYVNEKKLLLANENDNATYKCDNCKFIVVTSWMEEE